MQIILAKLAMNGVRGPASYSPTTLIQQEAQLAGMGQLVVGITGKNREPFFFITLKQFYHRFYPHFLGIQHLLHFHVFL